jgi:membrane associated rhomboid family serine protease
MSSASVGFHCPDCVRSSGQRVHTMSDVLRGTRPIVTEVLVATNVGVFVLSVLVGGGSLGRGRGGDLVAEGGVHTAAVAGGEWYRLVTAGFLHRGVLHLVLNMLLLYALGRMLEPAIGSGRFALLYGTALLAASFGIEVLDPQNAAVVGASGAVYGLMGAAIVAQRVEGIDPWQSGIAVLVAANLLVGFLVPGISIGGHVGGILGGALAAWLLLGLPRRTGSAAMGVAACAAFAVVAAAGAVLIARAAYPELAFVVPHVLALPA